MAIKAKALDYFAILQKKLDGIKEEGKTKHYFGNGRGVRTFFQYMQIGLAVRLANSENDGDLHTFKLADIDFAYNKFGKGHERLARERETKIGFGNL